MKHKGHKMQLRSGNTFVGFVKRNKVRVRNESNNGKLFAKKKVVEVESTEKRNL